MSSDMTSFVCNFEGVLQVVTKNTFIDVQPVAASNRASSVPAAARLAGYTNMSSPYKSPKAVGSICFGDFGAEESTEGGSDSASATSEDSAEDKQLGPTQEGMEVVAPVFWAAVPVVPVVPIMAPGPPPPPAAPQSTRLSASAKAWKPIANTVQKPKKAQEKRFEKQCETIASAVEAALSEITGAVTTETVRVRPNGWAVVAHVRAAEIHLKERYLLQAKEELLSAASGSDNVYVLGYKARPFVATVMGFDAMLGTMEDESQACWETYEQGFCARGSCCRWKHPKISTTLGVMIKLSE